MLGATSILSVGACRNTRLCRTPDAEQSGTSCKAQHVEGVWSGSHSPSYNAEARTASCRHLHPSRTQPPLCIAAHICQLLKGLGLLWLPDGLLAGDVHRCNLGLWVDLAAQADVHALLSAEGRCSTSPCSDRLLDHLLPLGCIAAPFRNIECSTKACETWLQVAKHCYAQGGVAPSCSAVLGSDRSTLLSILPVTAVRATWHSHLCITLEIHLPTDITELPTHLEVYPGGVRCQFWISHWGPPARLDGPLGCPCT